MNLDSLLHVGDSALVWGNAENTPNNAISLYMITPTTSLSPSSLSKCRMIHQGEPFGPILAPSKNSSFSSSQNDSKHLLPTDYLFIYKTSPPSSSGLVSILLARSLLEGLIQQSDSNFLHKPVREYWNENIANFGPLKLATPILYLDFTSAPTLSVTWSHVHGVVLAYGYYILKYTHFFYVLAVSVSLYFLSYFILFNFIDRLTRENDEITIQTAKDTWGTHFNTEYKISADSQVIHTHFSSSSLSSSQKDSDIYLEYSAINANGATTRRVLVPLL